MSFTAWIGGERGIAAEAAREALECLDAEDHMIRCQSATVLGLSQDDMDARALAFEQALVYAGQGNVSHVTIFAHGCRAYLLVMQGRLREALVACREAMRLAKSNDAHQPLPTLSYVYSTMSLVLWEWNDLDGALKHAREAVALALRWEQADALHFAYTNLGSALFALGDVEGAFEILHQAWQVAHRTSAWFEEITVAQEIEWYLAEDNREAALQRLRRARVDLEEPSGPFLSSALFMAFAQIFLAQKQYSKALAVIAPILEDLEKKKVLYFLVRTLTWQALAYQGLEQDKQALASLRRALILAAPEGYVRSFFVGGETFVSLLHQARAAGIAPDHVDKLLAAVGCDETAPLSREGASSELVESLSRREMDVMRRLAQGCSDKQIAEALVVSPETIHKHLKNIYGKLGVHNRTEAVVHARELGLL
jgi:LuxR family maltose regulon positive regulatory protein